MFLLDFEAKLKRRRAKKKKKIANPGVLCTAKQLIYTKKKHATSRKQFCLH